MAVENPVFCIDPKWLEDTELQYEDGIRPVTGETAGQYVNEMLGRVVQKMNKERAENVDPKSIGQLTDASNEEINDELNLCRQMVNELMNHVTNQLVIAATAIPLESPPRIKNRLLHYEYRLARIPVDKLELDQRLAYERTATKIESQQRVLNTMVQPNAEGHAILRLLNLNTSAPPESLGREHVANSTMNGETPANERQTSDAPASTDGVQAQGPNGPQQQTRPEAADPLTAPRVPLHKSVSYTDGMAYMARDARNAFSVAFDNQQPSIFQYTAADNTNATNPFVSVPFSSTEAHRYEIRGQPDGPNIQGPTPLPRVNAQANRHAAPLSGATYTETARTQSQQMQQPHAPQPQQAQALLPLAQLQQQVMQLQQQLQQLQVIPPSTQTQAQQRGQQPGGFPSFSTSHNGYHPATTPYPYQPARDPLNLDVLPVNGPNAQPMNMNPCQAQQFLGRILANRKYEGYQSDQKQFVSLEEFISLVKQYKISTGYADRAVLSQVSTFMTGAAFTWWKANGSHLNTLEEMEERLRTRFERQATDPISIVLEFASRKQGKEEDLLDYIDEMKQRWMRCPTFPEWQAVEKIVDNTNEVYNRILAARPFSSMDHLSRHAEYLMRGKPRRTTQPVKIEKRPPYPRRIFAIEQAPETEAEDMHEVAEVEEETDGQCDEVSTLITEFVAALQNKGNRSGPRKSNQSQKRSDSRSALTAEAQPRKESDSDAITRRDGPVICTNCCTWGHTSAMCKQERKIRCFGCGKEGVYKAQCDNCNSQNPKNQ